MLIYSTEPVIIGRHSWRFEVREVAGERYIRPVWRRIGDTGTWRYPADFTGSLPAALTGIAIENVRSLARAMETAL